MERYILEYFDTVHNYTDSYSLLEKEKLKVYVWIVIYTNDLFKKPKENKKTKIDSFSIAVMFVFNNLNIFRISIKLLGNSHFQRKYFEEYCFSFYNPSESLCLCKYALNKLA